MPCITARRRSGSWSTRILNSSSDNCLAFSCGENVSGQVAHLLLQRLATSKYASTGEGNGCPCAARRTNSSRLEPPVVTVVVTPHVQEAWLGYPGPRVLPGS